LPRAPAPISDSVQVCEMKPRWRRRIRTRKKRFGSTNCGSSKSHQCSGVALRRRRGASSCGSGETIRLKLEVAWCKALFRVGHTIPIRMVGMSFSEQSASRRAQETNGPGAMEGIAFQSVNVQQVKAVMVAISFQRGRVCSG
jgi:hypothetical protein